MPSPERIGDWSTSQLIKFVQQVIQEDSTLNSAHKLYEELTVTRKLLINDELQFFQNQLTVGAAGSASALPATPSGYIKILDPTGTVMVVPYFKSS